MKLMQFMGAVSVISMFSLTLSGVAAADSVAVTTTGPGSTQTVSTSNVTKTDTTNKNDVSVANINIQDATTGSVSAKDNTSVTGGIGSGSATNKSTANTVVTIGNTSSSTPGEGGSTGTPGVGSGTVPPGLGGGTGASEPSGTNPAPGRGGGSVLGASTVEPGLGGGQEILPVTGPIVPVDVSAIRAAWHPQSGTSPSTLVRHTSFFTAGMLITATLLSLLGAMGSAIYARRRERVV